MGLYSGWYWDYDGFSPGDLTYSCWKPSIYLVDLPIKNDDVHSCISCRRVSNKKVWEMNNFTNFLNGKLGHWNISVAMLMVICYHRSGVEIHRLEDETTWKIPSRNGWCRGTTFVGNLRMRICQDWKVWVAPGANVWRSTVEGHEVGGHFTNPIEVDPPHFGGVPSCPTLIFVTVICSWYTH